ncbi:MAG: alanine/glycine:cation symporter family protein [Corynebacterium sp.]|nr:alanine/glycine:cation symporter family protein [Corynebacterium sp.]
MDKTVELIEAFNNKYWYLVIVLLVVAGVWFGLRTLFVQIRYIPDMFKAVTEKPAEDGGEKQISAFKAFTISAASRVGTGNVAGVALAISLGGPGAVFWMWMLALLGGATSFVESTLAQAYKSSSGDAFRGGPAYYITKALGWKWMAALFAILITVTYGFVFNAVQSNSIAAAMVNSFDNGHDNTIKLIVGLITALVTALVIFGGVHRIANVTQVIVPIMAMAYVVVGIIVIIINIKQVPGMFSDIIAGAFGVRQFVGATFGAVVMQGVRRGLFSNEAGMGSVPNAAATATVSHPVKQGLSQTLGVYFDTILVCTITAFIVLLGTKDLGAAEGGMALTQHALANSVGEWGIHFLTVLIIFLAYSSVIGNYYYGEANIQFLTQNKSVMPIFRLLVVLCVFLGALGTIPLVWSLADVFSGLMATVNLIALIPLGGVALVLLKNYDQQRHVGKDPQFYREDIPSSTRGWAGMECWDKK